MIVCGLGNWGLILGKAEFFSLSYHVMTILVWGPTELFVQWVLGAISPEVHGLAVTFPG